MGLDVVGASFTDSLRGGFLGLSPVISFLASLQAGGRFFDYPIIRDPAGGDQLSRGQKDRVRKSRQHRTGDEDIIPGGATW